MQTFFNVQAHREATGLSVWGDDSVAGNHDENGIFSDSAADRTGGVLVSDHFGNLAVGPGHAKRDL